MGSRYRWWPATPSVGDLLRRSTLSMTVTSLSCLKHQSHFWIMLCAVTSQPWDPLCATITADLDWKDWHQSMPCLWREMIMGENCPLASKASSRIKATAFSHVSLATTHIIPLNYKKQGNCHLTMCFKEKPKPVNDSEIVTVALSSDLTQLRRPWNTWSSEYGVCVIRAS